jgi:ribosomal protein L20A (L18A)
MEGVYSDCRDRGMVECDVTHSLQSCEALNEAANCEVAYSDCLDTYCLEEKAAYEKVYDAFVSAKALCESSIQQAKSP